MAAPDVPTTPRSLTDADRPGADRPGGTAVLAGRTVSRIGYGAMQLTRLADDRADATALLHRALDVGIDHIDTAEFYGDGVVNDMIRQALRAHDDVLLASKIGADATPDGPRHIRLAQRPEELRASVDDNLRTLGVEQIAVMNLRRPDDRAGLRAEGEQSVDLDDQLATMISLREEGKIGAIGLSNVTLGDVRQALPAGIVCVQNSYSLVGRGDSELFGLCLAEEIAWVPFFPLGGAVAGLPKVTDHAAVQAAAETLEHTPSQIGLAWLLHHAPNILLIPGTANVEHLEANVAAGSIHLDQATLAGLDAVQG